MKLWEVLFRDKILRSPLNGQVASLSPISVFVGDKKTPLTVPKRREPKEKTHIPEHLVPGLADIGSHIL